METDSVGHDDNQLKRFIRCLSKEFMKWITICCAEFMLTARTLANI